MLNYDGRYLLIYLAVKYQGDFNKIYLAIETKEDVPYEVIKPKKTRKRTKKSKRTDSGKKDAR